MTRKAISVTMITPKGPKKITPKITPPKSNITTSDLATIFLVLIGIVPDAPKN